jgi:hypothetical protein
LAQFCEQSRCNQLVQIIRRQLQAQQITERWSRLRQSLDAQCRVTASFRCPHGRTLPVRKATQAESARRTIDRALGLDESPGGVKKMVV